MTFPVPDMAARLRGAGPGGLAARFETRTGDNRHHLVCRSCGRTTDVDRAVGARCCLTPSDDAGYRLDEAEVVFWGLCPDCRLGADRQNDRQFHHEKETP